MSCTSKYIEHFCTKYLGLGLDFSGGSSPTIEVTLIGHQDPTAAQIAYDLKKIHLPITRITDWDIASIEHSKSSSGAITKVKLIDAIWVGYNSIYVSAGQFNGYGDDGYILGKEFFNVTGVAIGKYDNIQRSVMVAANDLRKHYHNLNSGTWYIDADGHIVKRPANMSVDDFITNHAPGLPNPYVEFGEWNYYSSELFNLFPVKNNYGITGIHNDSGTAFDVLSSIGSKFGKIFHANSIWGVGYEDNFSDYGKRSVLSSAGIAVPDIAVQSSTARDYSAGYSASFMNITKAPGRYVRDLNKADTTIVNNNINNNYSAEPKGQYENGKVMLGRKLNLSGFYEEDALAWTLVKDHPIIEAYGTAELIAANATKIKGDISDLYGGIGSGRVWYQGVEAVMKTGDSIATAKSKLEISDSNYSFDDQVTAWQNDGRFWYATKATDENGSTRQVTANGESADTLYGGSFGFENFGTAARPLGSKSWNLETAGSVFYVPSNAQSVDFGFPNSQESTIESITGGNCIMMDYGSVSFPGSVGYDTSTAGLENFIDFTSSVLDSNKTQFGGVAAIDLAGLKQESLNLLTSVKNSIKTQGSRRGSTGAYAYWSGIKDPELWYTGGKKSIDDDGRSKSSSSLSSEEKKETINQNIAVHRKYGGRGCSFAPSGGAARLNRHIFHNVSSMSWYGGSLAYDVDIDHVKIIDGGRTFMYPYKAIEDCTSNIHVPYIESISFTLENAFYPMSSDAYKYLESLNISVIDGKVTNQYKFSQRSSIPDLKNLRSVGLNLKKLMK